jgi:PII-like signaling protein
MVKVGPAKKLTVYVDEADKYGGKPVYEVLLDIFFKRKMAGVSVFKGIAGYGSDGVFHTSKMLELSINMPVKLEIVESEETINNVLPDVYQVVEKGLVEVSDTNVIKCCRNASDKQEEEKRMKLEGKAKMLRIIVSEDDKWEGEEPLYEAIVKRLIIMDIAGATVYKAIAGYGPHRRYHKKKTLAKDRDLSMQIVVIDSEDKINKVLPVLDDMVGEGIVVMSEVNVIKYTHRDVNAQLL